MSEKETKFYTEVIDLPSRGWFYPETNPLSSGQVELYYMTAKHEDILTSRNLIQKGIVIDKLLEALIVNPQVKMNDLLLGDKTAIMVASRILGYGKDYEVNVTCPSCGNRSAHTMNLEQTGDKECKFFTDEHRGQNAFPFELPMTKKTVIFRYLTHGDEKAVRAEISGLQKAMKLKHIDREVTTRLKRSILSVDGDEDGETVRQFVDSMPARDAMALRQYIRDTGPDVDLTSEYTCEECNYEGRVEIPIDLNFFWPNIGV